MMNFSLKIAPWAGGSYKSFVVLQSNILEINKYEKYTTLEVLEFIVFSHI